MDLALPQWGTISLSSQGTEPLDPVLARRRQLPIQSRDL